MQEMHVPSVGQEDPLEKEMATHSSILAWRIPWTEEPGGLQSIGLQESDTTEWLHFHFSLSCIGEGNGNPLQCSCLENPRDRGAWRATVHGVTKSWKCRSTQSRNVCSRPNSTVLVLYSYEMYRVFFILSLPLIMHHFLMNLSSAHRCRKNEEHCLMPGIQEPHQHFLWAPSLRTGVID